jgi:hypothetical protein
MTSWRSAAQERLKKGGVGRSSLLLQQSLQRQLAPTHPILSLETTIFNTKNVL